MYQVTAFAYKSPHSVHPIMCGHTPLVEVAGADLPGVFSDPRDILVKVVAVGTVMLPVSMLRNISRLEKVRHTSLASLSDSE